MTDLNHFEDELRGMLAEVEANARPDDGLEQRLLAGATDTPARPGPHRIDSVRTLGRRAPRWLPPLLAAAAVIAVVVGAAITVNTDADRGQPATPLPTVSVSPSITNPPTGGPSVTPTGGPRSAVPVGFVGVSTWFRDARNGYVIGNVPCHAKPRYCATLVRTGDGGATWVTVPLPKGITPVDDKGNVSGGSCGSNGNVYGPCVDQVAFADANHGYLWSHNYFFSTIDGGQSWTMGMDPGTQHGYARATQLVFAGSQAWRIGPVADCSSGCAYQVQWATIGSSTWHSVTPSDPKPFQLGKLVVAASTVYVVGGTFPNDGSAPVTVLYRWTGSGWHKVATSCASGSGTPVAAPDGALFWWCATENGAPTVQRLDGSGSTAHPVPYDPLDPNAIGAPALALVAVTGDRLLAFVQPASATAAPYTEHESDDGGTSWHTVGKIEPWRPVTASFGYRLGADGTTVDVTTDGGASFDSHRLA